jgi:DNA-binding transcriptional LysR family regulator
LKVASLYAKSMEMELRHLRYFLAVAEELNFTRAARRLHIAQPPLTQQIKALEAEIGVTLIDRSAYRIELTDAGRAFAAEVSRILGDVRNAVLVAKRAARSAAGQVRVGFTASASFNPLVTSAFLTFRSDFPGVDVTLEESHSTELALALHEGRIDAAFVRPPLTADGILVYPLEEEEMVVAVARGHRLARRKGIHLRELEAERFILYPRTVRPGLADTVVAACEQAGFVPKVEQYAPQLSSTINLVATSLGISIVPRSMQGLQPHAVTYLPIRGRPLTALLGIAHRTAESSAPVLEFVSTARAIATSGKSPGGAVQSNTGPQ